MATTSSTTKAKPDNPNLTRTRSLGRKTKPPSSTVSSDDGSEQKPEKPLPNYLKPTISSRPDPLKFLKKNNNSLDDNQKLLRRRSFDKPPSSLTSPSTSASPRIPKSLNVSPSRPRDRPAVPREKPLTAPRSSSFHGSRNVPRGGTTAKSPHVAPKKSGLSSGSNSSKSKKEGSENVTIKKASDKEITLDSASLSSAQEDDHQDEILKVETDHVQVVEDIEELKDDKENKEVQVEVVQGDESGEENNESGGPTMVASPVGEDKDCTAVIKESEEKLINEDKTEVEEKIEETKEQDNKGEDGEDVENETPEKVDIHLKEAESVEETIEENEVKEEEKEEVKEEEKEKVKEEEKVKQEEKEEEKEKVKEEESGEGKKREVVKGKKESPSAYNDVIASKIQENPRKNKVLALAGAFQTVIDYETAASK